MEMGIPRARDAAFCAPQLWVGPFCTISWRPNADVDRAEGMNCVPQRPVEAEQKYQVSNASPFWLSWTNTERCCFPFPHATDGFPHAGRITENLRDQTCWMPPVATRCHPLHPHPVARDILARWSQCLGLSQSGLATARAKALRERWDVVAFTFWAE